MRTSPYTTPRLRRDVFPKADPMSKIAETETPEVDEDGEDGEEPETLLEAWETDNDEVCYELHGFDDHDEVLAVGGESDPDDEETEGDDRVVALALNLKELDEAIEILTEIRGKMAERDAGRGSGKLRRAK
jgi:hypothetical protein